MSHYKLDTLESSTERASSFSSWSSLPVTLNLFLAKSLRVRPETIFHCLRKLSRWFSVCLCPIIFSFRIFYTAYILHETIYLYNFRLLDFIDFVMNKWYNIMFIPNNIWLSCRFIGSLTSRYQPDIKYCNVQQHSWELQRMIIVIE